MLGRKEWGYDRPVRFVYAAEIVATLGYKETNDPYDWVPIAELYDRYEEIWTDRPHGHQTPTLLARSEFGELLGQVFHGDRVIRRVLGKKARGIAGIQGPGGLRSRKPPDVKISLADLEKLVDD
ncbi:hypothetical protein LCGC14_1415620 [marine sediment metagenome]|uniref:Uncharacterized protein n=1 Tax=marine sediment metagenome TaxID=412755 RepID=A0A0F9JTB0_9ZZZZ